VKPHAELSALDVVSVLFFDTPTLTRTDPPPVEADRALSAVPQDKLSPDAVAAPSAAIEPASDLLKQAGVTLATPQPEGVAQAQP
jgi:hypothetical protein